MSQNDRLFSLICQIKCGKETGNGFQISKDYIITARHVVAGAYKNDTEITVQFDGEHEKIKCFIIEDLKNPDNPLAALKLNTPRQAAPPLLGTSTVSPDLVARAFGFASNADAFCPRGDIIELQCTRNIEEEQTHFEDYEDYNVIFKPVQERKLVFNGYSGSPVILDGYIIGILLQQTRTNEVADRILGLCGVQFRTYLKNFNIPFNVHESKENSSDSISVSIPAMKTKNFYVVEIDQMVSESFSVYYHKLIDGDLLYDSQESQEFIKNLGERQCSLEKKAECYYSIACYLLSDGQNTAASNLYCKAKEYNPNLDDRVYQAILLVNDNKIDLAKNLLQPVNSISILNAYLMCMLEEHRQINEVRAAVEILGHTPTSQTYRLLSICSLNSNDFDLSRSYLINAQKGHENSPELAMLDVLIDYWSALSSLYPNVDKRNIIFISGFPICLTNEQKNYLESAYQKLERIYSHPIYQSNTCLLGRCTWMLIAISSILSGKDTKYWIQKFRNIYIAHPLDILFCLEHDIEIPKENIDQFLSKNRYVEYNDLYSVAKLKLLVFIGRYDEAWRFFEANKESVAKGNSNSISICRLQLAIECGKYEEAKKLLADIDLGKQERTRFGLAIESKCIRKTYNPFLKKAVSFAVETGKTLDFHNAAQVCRKYKKWKEAEKNAKAWWECTGNITALAYLTESLYEKDNFRKCLRVIERFEQLSELPTNLRTIKINCYIALAEYQEAIIVASTFVDGDINPKLVVIKSNIYKNEGKLEQSLKVLQNFADKGLFDFNVYQQLIEQLQGTNPDLAYHYAEAYYQHSPDDKNALALAGQTSIMTGHFNSNISERYYEFLSNVAKTGKCVQMLDVQQVMDLMKQNSERNRQLEQRYRKVNIPIHLISSNSLGGIIWDIIHDPYLPYYGRTYSTSDEIIEFNKPLLVDYTTFLLLSHLEILETVANSFSNLSLSCDIFSILSADITDLRNVQYFEIEKNKIRSRLLNKISYIPLELERNSEVPKNDNSYDYLMLLGAKKYKGYIIQNEPCGIIHKQETSDEWYQKQIKPANLYAVLKQYALPYPTFNDADVDECVCGLLQPHTKIVLDNEVLDELCDSGAIEAASELFDLVIPQFIVDQIHADVQKNMNRIQAADWLDKCRITASVLYEKRKIKLLPVLNRKYSQDNRYCQLLLDEIQIAEDNDVTVIFDDRYMNSMGKICGKKHESPIISTYDLLVKLHVHNIIDDPAFYTLIDKLLAMGYCHILVPANYTMSRLQIARVNDDGMIAETLALKNIRRSTAVAFHKEFGLRDELIKNREMSERFSYLMNNHKVFSEVISCIWRSKNSLEWCTAASDWCLYFLGDWVSDIKEEDIGNFSFKAIEMLALKLVILIMDAFTLYGCPNFKEYVQWMKQFVFTACHSNPEISVEIANTFNHYLSDLILNPSANKQTKHAIQTLISQVISELPTSIIQIIAKSNDWFRCDLFTIAKLQCKNQNQCSNFQIGTFETNGFVGGDYTQLENAIMYLMQNPRNNMSYLKEIITEDLINKVNSDNNQQISQGLAALSQYAVADDIAYLQDLKRKTSMIVNCNL